MAYTVKRKTDNGDYSVIASEIKDSGYFDKNVEENKTYSYMVSKTDSSGKVTNLNVVTIKHVIVDTDGDGLPDDFEESLGTDKTKSDTDGNGILDGDEDADKDGLTNSQELKYGTNPLSADTDNDGLSDYDEINKYNTDPCKYDTDEDGLGDGVEVLNGLNPLDKDTDKDGIIDFQEVFEQSLLDSKYKNIDISKTLVKPNLKITGCGDYSKQISVKDASDSSEIFSDIHSMVGDAFAFTHDSDLKFQSGNLSFKVSDGALKDHDLKNLRIAWYNTDNNDLNILDTNIDSTNNTISTTINHLSCYCVVDVQDFAADIAAINANNTKGTGKADVVFAIDTTGSMGPAIANVRDNIDTIMDDLKSKGMDIRFGLIEYKDITCDGVNSTIDHGWSTDVDEFKNKLDSLSIDGGGDEPESALDGLEISRKKDFRADASKYIVLITDASCKNGTKDDPNRTIDSENKLLEKDDICVSAITSDSGKSDYETLVQRARDNSKSGILGNIYGNFSTVLQPFVERVEYAINKTPVLLANGECVWLDDDPAKGTPVDTDGDGLTDLEELDKEIEKTYFDVDSHTLKTYKCWTFKSNPAEKDTDGDGIDDKDDKYPLWPEIGLKNKDFVKIDGGTYYGGDQDWLGSKKYKGQSCVHVATANIMAYLAANKKNCGNLYPYDISNITKSDFTKFVKNTIYKYIVPNLDGSGATIDQYEAGITYYLNKKKCDYSFNYIENAGFDGVSCDEMVNKIKQEVNSDFPVVLSYISVGNPVTINFSNGTDRMETHSVTITGITEDLGSNQYYLTISTWGKNGEVSLNDLWRSTPDDMNHWIDYPGTIYLGYFQKFN